MKQTFVIVTHNEELANMADRKIFMKDGVIVETWLLNKEFLLLFSLLGIQDNFGLSQKQILAYVDETI